MRFKKITNKLFNKAIDKLSNNLSQFRNQNNIKIDYICPILRSGAVPAVYLANKLNIVKFLPMQIKHITYSNQEENIITLLDSFELIKNKNPKYILLVEGTHYTGTSVKICADKIKNTFPECKILYVCLCKKYNSLKLSEMCSNVIYEDFAYIFEEKSEYNCFERRRRNINFKSLVLYPWEIKEQEAIHPDDLEENIFF